MELNLNQHPRQEYTTRLSEPGTPVRAVLLGQHPQRLLAVADLMNQGDVVRVVAGVADILDCGVVLNAQIPRVDLLLCGGYFELTEVRDMLAEVANDNLRLLKVPDGLMMDHGGPPAVKKWIEEQVRANTFTPVR
ncbi:hypothetical protein JCM8208_003720 [Rhodotorula glutinis]